MNIVFCLFKYFPFGGLQLDFAKIAQKCFERGHTVDVFTMEWEGPVPDGLIVHKIPVKSRSNHGRSIDFASRVQKQLAKISCDVVVGFNKMPGLDVYYAADTCYRAKVMESRSALYRMTPRCRTYLQLEQAVFNIESTTEILLLSPPEKSKFIQYYGTSDERFHLLPPGISKDRFVKIDSDTIRLSTRQEYGFSDNDLVLLMVGSAFTTKGVDRVIAAVASLPATLRNKSYLLVIGKGKSEPLLKMAARHNVDKQVRFLGGRDDVPRFLQAADLLVHPARTENTGTVLVEAMAAGLPVLATENCGYSFHVKAADAGRLVPMPYSQENLNLALKEFLSGDDLAAWGRNGTKYTASVDVTGLHDQAVAVIETVSEKRASH